MENNVELDLLKATKSLLSLEVLIYPGVGEGNGAVILILQRLFSCAVKPVLTVLWLPASC